MNIVYLTLIILACGIVGYLFGSINFALIICKMKGIDIYKVGSGNAGGTNVGRALGKKYAFLTIFLDVLKTLIPMWSIFFIFNYTSCGLYVDSLVKNFPVEILYYTAGLCAGIGHKWPIYYKFKGGKAVSCFGGFIVATNWLFAVIGLSFFLLVFAIKKRVSIASILSVIMMFTVSLIVAFFPIPTGFSPSWILGSWFFSDGLQIVNSYIYSIYLLVFGFFVILFHKSNIKRIIKKEEPETHYRHKGDDDLPDSVKIKK